MSGGSPVAPTGLTGLGRAAVVQFLEAGVHLAGVNGMPMDYGAGRPEGTSMLTASQNAADAMHRQAQAPYRRAGLENGPQDAWRHFDSRGPLRLDPVEGCGELVARR